MIQQGDKVFLGHNYDGLSNYDGPAWKTIESLGLTPIVYAGIGLNVRGSSLGSEIHNDFYQSVVVILLLGKGEGWQDVADNWILAELSDAISIGIACFVYTLDEVTELEVSSLGLPSSVEVVAIRNEAHFTATLRQHLENLMTSS